MSVAASSSSICGAAAQPVAAPPLPPPPIPSLINPSLINPVGALGGGGSDIGKKSVIVEWPRIVLALSRKEKEEDFLIFKGAAKLSQRPKKRLKVIEKTLLVSLLLPPRTKFIIHTNYIVYDRSIHSSIALISR